MIDRLRLMDPKAYKDHRFRKARSSLYPGDYRQIVFPAWGAGTEPRALLDSGREDCLVWIPYGRTLDPVDLEQMELALHHAPRLDGVYFRKDRAEQPHLFPILMKKYVVWGLGGWPDSEDFRAASIFWLQASLAFNLYGIGAGESNGSVPHNLYLELETINPVSFSVLADFCLDYYLYPWICFLHSDRLGPRSSGILDQLKEAITTPGNIIYEGDDFHTTNLPRLWIPSVYLLASENLQNLQPPPEGIPQNSLKVLLDLSQGEPPEDILQDWDLCLAIGKMQEKPPLLRSPWQGWIYSKDIPSLVKFLDVRAHASHFGKICSFVSRPGAPTRKISVVISTFHRHEALRQSLQTVAHQTLPADDYEVIVVNNDPQDSQVRQLVETIRAGGFDNQAERLRLIDCPLPGLSYARNSGIAEASGEVICFIDDDALAHENWLTHICHAFADHPDSGVIGGHIQLVYPQPRPKILKKGLERFWTQFITKFDDYTEVNHWMDFPWGANWCVRRKALMEIGGFRGQYGRRQNDFSGGEEIIAASLIQRLGYQIGIMPTAIVDHKPDPSRYTFQYLLNTVISQIIVNYRMHRDQYLPETTTASKQVRGLGRFAGRLLELFSMPSEKREALTIEYICYILAWSRLFFEQLGDTLSRLWYRD